MNNETIDYTLICNDKQEIVLNKNCYHWSVRNNEVTFVDIVLCSWAITCTVTVRLSTSDVYKWVLATLMLDQVTLQWTSIPSMGSRNTPSHLMLQRPG